MASESGIRYADLDTPEAHPWGPPGIFAVREGYAVPWEAAGNPYGRVVNRWSAWSYVNGFSSWRSRTSCN